MREYTSNQRNSTSVTFWTQDWESKPPSVWIMHINGRVGVACKQKRGLPTTCFFPNEPENLEQILSLAIDIYLSTVTGTVSPESQGAREQLLKLTSSIESLPENNL